MCANNEIEQRELQNGPYQEAVVSLLYLAQGVGHSVCSERRKLVQFKFWQNPLDGSEKDLPIYEGDYGLEVALR